MGSVIRRVNTSRSSGLGDWLCWSLGALAGVCQTSAFACKWREMAASCDGVGWCPRTTVSGVGFVRLAERGVCRVGVWLTT